MYYIYMLRCRDGSFYTGIAADIEKRLRQHASGGAACAKYTRAHPPEALAHLTEAFYRVDKSRSRAQGGAGLGLSLCNEIVQLHGGTMQFESRVGNGTVVTVELKGGRV